MRSLTKAVPAVVVLALGACAAVGPNFKPPTTPAASGYAMAGDAVPGDVALSPDKRSAGAWWRDLGSQRLNAVTEQALLDNQTVAAALAALDKAREQAASVRGG